MTDETAEILRDQARASLGTEEAATRAILRELRGELAEIRMRLDSLVAIEKQLSYQSARMSWIEKRLTTLVEMRLNQTVPVPSATFQSPPG